MGFLEVQLVKNLPVNAGDARDMGSIPGLGRSPREGNGNLLQDFIIFLLQYSCWENSMDRGAWRAIVHGVTKESDMTERTHTHTHGRNMPSCAALFSAAQSCLTCVTPWTVARQPPLSMGFSRPEHWRGVPCPPPGDLPHPEIQPRSPALQADSLLLEPPGKPNAIITMCK